MDQVPVHEFGILVFRMVQYQRMIQGIRTVGQVDLQKSVLGQFGPALPENAHITIFAPRDNPKQTTVMFSASFPVFCEDTTLEALLFCL